ncbi:DUF4244 domain-containing protein [Streptomyces sp. TRM 70351]|uniref:DUF4244 domain-containing protein n=1 Tax=Streptomyces sp. TRM 70351 TaxID=3116552 RepID=UPI002E7BA984|nr:DUF4244 domain-containing protein [Streptomyces sp. TRM 70351]MEE1930276.1 DUF4244 domain-containing protein [Streptomyces sp. TRM 70351]
MTTHQTKAPLARDVRHRGATGRLLRSALRPLRPLARRIAGRSRGQWRDAGMSTAEYAVGTIAACGFAAVLYKVVTSGPVSAAMQKLVERALDAGF